MDINVYLEDCVARQLLSYSEKFHRKRDSIVQEAIKDWLKKHSKRQWPESILQFEGLKEFPSIEEIREGLTAQ